MVNPDPIWKGALRHDPNSGGMIFCDFKKLDKQKQVFSHIIHRIGKNLMAGKSILNISLPVLVFSAYSNLQHFAISLSTAPLLLEPVAEESDPLAQLLAVSAWAHTNTVLYV
jgi:hypothetical protein